MTQPLSPKEQPPVSILPQLRLIHILPDEKSPVVKPMSKEFLSKEIQTS
jgi:hypothetical protein